MHFSQVVLAFAAVVAAGVTPMPRDTYELEERGNGLTARNAIELQADVEIASASDEETPELEPRTKAAVILEVRQKRSKKRGNSVVVVDQDTEAIRVPDSDEADGEELEARQAEAIAGVVTGLKNAGKPPKAPAAVRERDAAEEDDVEELEARQDGPQGGVITGSTKGGKPPPAPKAPAAVRDVDPLQTPAPVLERDAAEEDDAEELEARATVAAGGSPKSAAAGGSPKSAKAGGAPKSAGAGGASKSAVAKNVVAQPTPAPELAEREEDDAEELEARATVAAGGSPKSAAAGGSPKSAKAGGAPKSAGAGGASKSAVAKNVVAQPTPAPELAEREEDDAEELEARATAVAGGAGKPKAAPAGGAAKGKPSAVVVGRAECTPVQIVKRETETVYVPVTRVVVKRQPRETVYVI